MRVSRVEKRIIGTLLMTLTLLAGGCTSVTLAYNNGPQLAWWWVDGYADFSRDQAAVVKRSLDEVFDWHRSTQLSTYLPWLALAQVQVLEATTPAAVCRWQEQLRAALDPTLERTLEQAADIVPLMGDAQFKHMEQRYAKLNVQLREDHLQPDPAERQAESVKRVLERAEMLYGKLDAAARRVVVAGVAASPFNPEAWIAERVRRQRDTVQTLRRLVADKADHDQRLAALRALVARVERSPDAEYRAYQVRLADYNCAFVAQVHNATSVALRTHGRDTLKGWAADLRVLMVRD